MITDLYWEVQEDRHCGSELDVRGNGIVWKNIGLEGVLSGLLRTRTMCWGMCRYLSNWRLSPRNPIHYAQDTSFGTKFNLTSKSLSLPVHDTLSNSLFIVRTQG